MAMAGPRNLLIYLHENTEVNGKWIPGRGQARRGELGEGGKTSQLDKQSKWNKRAEANELPALEAALVLRPVLWSTVLPGEQLHLSARAELPRNPRKKWLVRESLTEVP